MSFCETKDLSVGYTSALIEHIAFSVERGKILTLIGPNGAGKSTLMQTLMGRLPPKAGAVYLDGKALETYTLNARAQKMALMVPHADQTELLTCFDAAAAGRYPYTGRLGILSEEDKEKVRHALRLVHAEEIQDRDFDKISDGQRQRILLARAVCQEPEILFLDEPTSFLDVKGKAELISVLRRLAKEQNTAVVLSLHELDLAQKLSDAVVCVSKRGVSGAMPVKEAFARENIQSLYEMSDEEYAAVFGKKEPPKFEHYIRSGQKLLRCGYTTGTCAALGAAGAARLLFTGRAPETVGLRTPKGIVVEVAPLSCELTAAGASCTIQKDGGDDIDITDGLPITAEVVLLPEESGTVKIDGGSGVGRVTKPGLDQPAGAAAINHVPREMIAEALKKEAAAFGYTGGFSVTVTVAGGEEAAKKTFNPYIGVVGGISILGTSGIVEPMSRQAIVDTMQLEIHQAALKEAAPRRLILTPGNYGLDYLRSTYPALQDIPVVKCSNFIGDALDAAAAEHFDEVLLVGHIGKLVKLAGGIMNTHSRTADCRTELFCAYAAVSGAPQSVCVQLMQAATTDACIDILDESDFRAPVLEKLINAVELHLERRAAGAFTVGAVLFSNQNGPLGQTETAEKLLQTWKESGT